MKYHEPDTTLRLARAVIGWAFALLAVTFLAFAATAQDTDDDYVFLTPDQLEELVGPIALYPDDLIAIVLPASTYPLQIVEAARFLDRRASDPNAAPDDDWDDSIVALLNYPEVVDFLNEDLDWTWSLGEAVLNQRADVLDAVQRFRGRARAAGNLRSDDRQLVVDTGNAIEIRHADPQVIYVPYYEPRRVVVYQPAPVIHYYPWTYPVYYYPYPVGYHFDVGFFFGVTSAFLIGWHDHFFHVHHHHHHLHPYFGHYYYDPFYVRRSVSINVHIHRDSYVWAPRVRTVGRPVRFNDGRPVTRTVERRVNDSGATRAVNGATGRSTRTTERRATTGPATDRSTAAGARTRTTEGGATASGTRTDRNTATGTRTNDRNGVGVGARPSANGTDGGASTRSSGGAGQTRTRESGTSTRIAPAVPNAPSRTAEPRVAPTVPAAPSTQQRTRVGEGRPSQSQGSTATTQRTAPSQPSTTTRRSTTQERPTITSRPQGSTSAPPPSSNARTQSSQPSAPSRSAQPAPQASAPSSTSSSGSSRTRGGDSGGASSSRVQSSGAGNSDTRTRTR